MMEWHSEFRAYARAFGNDEVAAILLRSGEDEWILWPKQTTEGMTFTLKANAILDLVPAEHLQHVVGWVHSHPCGLMPEPSTTDDEQIRDLARDFEGQIAEMWIFGSGDYSVFSVTKATLIDDTVYVSDTVSYRQARERTPFDETAQAFYKESKPARVPEFRQPWPMLGEQNNFSSSIKYDCAYCQQTEAEYPGMLCEACELTDIYGSLGETVQ